MSYINEALKKAQKNKDARHIGYIHSLGKAGRAEYFFKKRYICLASIVILALLIFFYSRFEGLSGQDSRTTLKAGENMPLTDGSFVPENKISGLNRATSPENNVTEVDSNEDKTLSQVEAHYKEAVSLLKKGETKEAKDMFKEILSLDPGHINSLNDMGVLSMQQGKYEDAITYLEKAVRLKPDYANPYYNLACIYSMQYEREKGMEYLIKAIDINESVKSWAKEDPDLNNLIKEYDKLMASSKRNIASD